METRTYPPEVQWRIDQNNKKEHLNLANKLNENPLVTGVILQHEYGIYGGIDGENILTLIENLKKPLIVTLHTVLPDPSKKMKEVTERIIKSANCVVVLTQHSKELLETIYPISIGKVYIIPHGVPYTPFSSSDEVKEKLNLKNHLILTTFGLLSRGKGIEHVISSLPAVVKKHPSVLYLILGETHPVVRRAEGEKYRKELTKLVTKYGLKNHVIFYDEYLSLKDLIKFLKATDIYISTSINPDQAVSGTLSYALGVGRAVVSTNFSQAKEIVTKDTGRLVEIKDSKGFASSINELLGDLENLKKMHKNAYELTRPMLWSNVAKQYFNLLALNILPPIDLTHLKKMTDGFGLFQFAEYASPNKKFGYTLDDNARALVVTSELIKAGYTKKVRKLMNIYLNFIEKSQLSDGTFINYINFEAKEPTSQNSEEDLEDANARAIWALGEILKNKKVSVKLKRVARRIFLKALPSVKNFEHLRSKASVIKAFNGLSAVLPNNKTHFESQIKENADFLVKRFSSNSERNWKWFEEHLGYNNGILSESLFIAGEVLNNKKYTKTAISSLEFLISKTFTGNVYLPIGHSDWYHKNGKRSHFDQQPEDPASMILGLAQAYENTHNEGYRNLANKCFSWFLGNNIVGVSVYNFGTGGSFDGLHPDSVNLNQGAESLVSYLLARLKIEKLNIDANSTN